MSTYSPLDQLKRILTDQGLYSPPKDDSPASHDDPTLLFVSFQLILLKYNTKHRRFLRARKFDPAKAHKQFAATEAWRRENRVLDLYATFDSDELESTKRFYPRWTGRRDKVSVTLILCPSPSNTTRLVQHGIPVYVFRLASLTGPLLKELNAVQEGRRYQRMCVSLVSSTTNAQSQHNSSHQRRPLGIHVPFYSSLLFRPPPPVPFDREFTHPHHFNNFDY